MAGNKKSNPNANKTRFSKRHGFELVKKSVENNSAPHYSIRTRDYVSVLAITRDKTFVLVRQFRPAIEMFTLELAGGHVDEGETPEQSARKELLEETGFVAEELANHELHNTRHTAARRFQHIAREPMPVQTLDGRVEPVRGCAS